MMTRILLMAILVVNILAIKAQNHWITYYEKSGGTETPRYNETYAYCRMLADSSTIVSWHDYGISPQGRSLFALVLDKDGLSSPDLIRSKGRALLFVQACIHPGEPDGKDAGLMLIRDIAIHGINRHLLDNVSLLFIPIVSPDGHERFGPYHRINQNGPLEMGWRTTATNLNLNRDFLKADAPEMQQWLMLFNRWLPDFFMDIHTTDGADYQYVITYGIENQGNIDSGLGNWIDTLFLPRFRAGMMDQGIPVFPYLWFKKWHDPRSGLLTHVSLPRYSIGYAAARNRVGLLVETHMLKPYDVRVEATQDLIRETMEIINTQSRVLVKLNKEADEKYNREDWKKKPFAVSYTLSDRTDSVDFLGYQYNVIKSDLTGNDWFIYSDTPQTFTLEWTHENLPDVEVKLPDAYVIPVEWSEIIHRLSLHGIEMDVLKKDTSMDIRSYKFSNVKFSSTPSEGRMLVTDLKAEEIKRTVTYHAGSVIIPIQQPAARLIAFALEPLSTESFLRWGFMNAIFERKEYVESYVMEKMAREMIAKNPDLLEEFKAFDKTIPDTPWRMWEQYNWFYSRTPYYDQQKDVYPVGYLSNYKP